jgi:MFS family permease
MTIAPTLLQDGAAPKQNMKNPCFVPMATGASASLISVDEPSPARVRDTPRRFAVLLSAACFMLGNYYFYDQTSATKETLQKHTGMSENTFGLLSSVYSWPNVVLPLFGGMFIDRFGVRVAVVFFTSLVAIGSMLFSVGLWSVSVPVLVVARVIFGMGGESQNVSALSLVSKWFA